jgi:hypothetical protein
MDTARKFIQMGRTRSLRYALRPGGRKYARVTDSDGDVPSGPSGSKSPKTQSHHEHEHEHEHAVSDGPRNGEKKGKEMQRTGKVYDKEKLQGAEVFRGYENRAWGDEVYADAWERWKAGERGFLSSNDSEVGKRKGAENEEHEETGTINSDEEADVGPEEGLTHEPSRKRKRRDPAESKEDCEPDQPSGPTRTQSRQSRGRR